MLLSERLFIEYQLSNRDKWEHTRTKRNLAGWIPCGETCLLGFKSSTWHGCSHFPRFIPRFNGAILSVVCDVSVGSEAHVVTSSISRFASPTQFFGGAHRGRVCMRAFIGLSVRLCLWASAPVTGSRKKRNCKSLTSDLLNNTMDWVGNR